MYKIAPLFVTLLASSPFVMAEQMLELFDAHIHYSIDVWDKLPPERALSLLSDAGIKRAIVSGSPGAGAERLYRAAPERIVPFIRPYARLRHRHTWFKETSVLNYVREQLARIPYRGIGEFHLPGKHARSPVVVDLVKLARERKLVLHAHTDRQGIEVLLELAVDIPVIWAHGGFDVAESALDQLLVHNKHLYIELSFREGMLDEQDKLTPTWYKLLTGHHNRFLTGMDTYTPQRWVMLTELAEQTREWLQQLPDNISKDIAFANAMRLFDQKQ